MSTADRLVAVRTATLALAGAIDGLAPEGDAELAAVRAASLELGEACSWFGGPGVGGIASAVLAALDEAAGEGRVGDRR